MGQFSVGKLLIGILLPGLLLAVVYATYVVIRCHIQPHLAPAYEVMPTPIGPRIMRTVQYVLPLVTIIGIVIGTIFAGVATPTEAAALGALFCFLLVACYGKLTWQVLKKSIAAATTISVMVFVILTGSAAFSQILAFTGITVGLTELALAWSEHPILILIAMQLVLLLLGMLIEQTSIVMITTPIYFPIVSAFGWDPVWFGAIMLLNLEMATISPPFGLSLFVMKGITSKTTTMGDIYRAALPFVALNLLVMAIMIAVPSTVLWLPTLMR
jgi:tripartite ATP-independent transporter DctM subunit